MKNLSKFEKGLLENVKSECKKMLKEGATYGMLANYVERATTFYKKRNNLTSLIEVLQKMEKAFRIKC